MFYRQHKENFTIDSTENNKKIISSSFKLLKSNQGVTFNLYFQPEWIKSYVILMIIIGMSLFINYKNKIDQIHYTPKTKKDGSNYNEKNFIW